MIYYNWLDRKRDAIHAQIILRMIFDSTSHSRGARAPTVGERSIATHIIYEVPCGFKNISYLHFSFNWGGFINFTRTKICHKNCTEIKKWWNSKVKVIKIYPLRFKIILNTANEFWSYRQWNFILQTILVRERFVFDNIIIIAYLNNKFWRSHYEIFGRHTNYNVAWVLSVRKKTN